MMRRSRLLACCGALLVVSILMGLPAGQAVAENRADLVICDGADRIRIDLSDNVLTIHAADDTDETEVAVDLTDLGLFIQDTVSECLTALDESQFALHLGNDNRLQLAMDDTEIELDLDEIIEQANGAVSAACAHIDVDEWVDSYPRLDTRYDDDELNADLREEIENLQREIRRLKKDLKRVRTHRVH